MRRSRHLYVRHALLAAVVLASLLSTGGAVGAPLAGDTGESVVAGTLEPVSAVGLSSPAAIGDGGRPDQGKLPGELVGTLKLRGSPGEVEALQAAAALLPVDPDIQNAAAATGAAPAAGPVAFDAMDQPDCCGGGAVVPPDPFIAVGPGHIVEVVNLAFQIFDKTGTSLVGPTTFSSFFAPAGSACAGGFDPTVVYDEEEDRFAIGVDGSGTDFCIAVSQTPDPTGAWWLYQVPALFNGATFHDYPHIGVGQDAIFVGANQFDFSFVESRVWALDKAAMYAGAALAPVTFSTGLSGTPQPLHFHGFAQGTWPTMSDHYFVTDPYDGDTLELWLWPNPLGGGTPSIVTTFDVEVASGVTSGFPVSVPQLGGVTIEANDWRFRGFEYRNGAGWVADTIACNPGAGTVDCVRWVEIDLSGVTPSVTQAGVYASNGEYRTFPDLAVNACGDMAVGYTKSSTSIYPGIWVTGRESADAAGTLQAEVLLKAGETVYSAFDGAPLRWGDYTQMAIDPDGVTFWYVGEYSKILPGSPANWGTYVGSFSYPDCAGDSMHLKDSLLQIREAQNRAVGRFTVEDEHGTLVSGATVSAEWSIDGVPQGVTARTSNILGRAAFTLLSPPPGALLELCVTDITAAGLVYDPGENLAPECVSAAFPGGGSAGTMHLLSNSIVLRVPQNRAVGRAVVEDNAAARVSGATVTSEWSVNGVPQGTTQSTTNSIGRVTAVLLNPAPGAFIEFCVLDITGAGLTYAPGDNLAPVCVNATWPV